MPTIYDLLTEDHNKVKSLLAKIQETGGSAEKTRDKLFAEVEKDLEIHTEFEEEVFYPAARKATGMDDEIEDDLEEHAEAKELLSKLASMKSTSEEWMETIEELTEALNHHIKDEETKLFPAARKAMDGGQAERMGERYQKSKEKSA
jgi:hemerythrin-like domain-containing protein